MDRCKVILATVAFYTFDRLRINFIEPAAR